MDGPGPQLPELHTLALPTPLREEYGTCFLSEASWERARRCKHGQVNRKHESAGEREGRPGAERLRAALLKPRLLPVGVEQRKADTQGAGPSVTHRCLLSCGGKRPDEIPPNSRGSQSRKGTTEPPWMLRQQFGSCAQGEPVSKILAEFTILGGYLIIETDTTLRTFLFILPTEHVLQHCAHCAAR